MDYNTDPAPLPWFEEPSPDDEILHDADAELADAQAREKQE